MRMFNRSDENDYPWEDDEPLFGATLSNIRREKWEEAKRLRAEGEVSKDDEIMEMMRMIEVDE